MASSRLLSEIRARGLRLLRRLISRFALATLVLAAGPAFPQSAPIGPTSSQVHNVALILLYNPAADDLQSKNLDGESVVWPQFLNKDGSNRLLSLVTGLDWQGDDQDLSFIAAPDGQSFSSAAFDVIRSRGVFQAREKWLGKSKIYAVSRPKSMATVNPDELLLAIDGNSQSVKSVPFEGPWPKGILDFEARTLGEGEAFANRVEGRSVIVGLPKKGNKQWSFLERRGGPWPDGVPVDLNVGVPGLIQAKSLIKLLIDPKSDFWANGMYSKDSFDSWFEYVRVVGPVTLLGLSIIFAALLCVATYYISSERKSRIAALSLSAMLIAPAALLIAGNIAVRAGLNYAFPAFAVVEALVLLANFFSWRLFDRSGIDVHPLLLTSIVGVIACATCLPVWSIYSGAFGYTTATFSSESYGLLAAYLCGLVSICKSAGKAVVWVGRSAALGFIVGGIFTNSWWVHDGPRFSGVVVLAWIAGEGWMNVPLVILFGLLPNAENRVSPNSISWSPVGAIQDLQDRSSLNLGRYFLYFFSPGFVGLVCLVGAMALFGDRFYLRQVRRAFEGPGPSRPLSWTALGVGVIGLLSPTQPEMIPAAVLVAFGALTTAFFDGVWSL